MRPVDGELDREDAVLFRRVEVGQDAELLAAHRLGEHFREVQIPSLVVRGVGVGDVIGQDFGTLGAATQNAIDLATWRMLEQLPPEDLAQGAAKLSELPAVMDKFLHAIHAKFVTGSKLSEEDKAEAKNIFRRFVKRMVSGTVRKESVDKIADKVFTRSGKGVKVKNLNDDDLRAIIRIAAAEAN